MVTTLRWDKIDDETWQAGGLKVFYQIKRFVNNGREHFSLSQIFPENDPENRKKYIVSSRTIGAAKNYAQDHLNKGGKIKG